jgi:hypothetical protein
MAIWFKLRVPGKEGAVIITNPLSIGDTIERGKSSSCVKMTKFACLDCMCQLPFLFNAGVAALEVPHRSNYKLYLDGGLLVYDSDLLIGELVNGNEIMMATSPEALKEHAVVLSRSASNASTKSSNSEAIDVDKNLPDEVDSVVWSENSQDPDSEASSNSTSNAQGIIQN